MRRESVRQILRSILVYLLMLTSSEVKLQIELLYIINFILISPIVDVHGDCPRPYSRKTKTRCKHCEAVISVSVTMENSFLPTQGLAQS